MISALALAAAASVWTVTDKSDAFSDKRYVTLKTEQGENLLVVKCVPGDTPWSMAVVTPDYIGGNPMMRGGMLRIDANKPRSASFAIDTYLADAIGGDSAAADVLSAKSKIAIRVERSRASNGNMEVLFDASGLPAKAADFRKKCAALGLSLK